MEILDIVVLIGAIREEDKHYEKAKRHLEFDLEMKTHGYTREERKLTWEDMLVKIPQNSKKLQDCRNRRRGKP